MSESTSASVRTVVEAIIARDGLQRLPPEDVERLLSIYAEVAADLTRLRAPEVAAAEPAVIFPAK